MLRNVDLGVANLDYVLAKIGSFGSAKVDRVIAQYKSGPVAGSVTGGCFDAAVGGGNAIILATTEWASLAAGRAMSNISNSNVCVTDTLILRLSASASPSLFVDIYAFGHVLS